MATRTSTPGGQLNNIAALLRLARNSIKSNNLSGAVAEIRLARRLAGKLERELGIKQSKVA